jgi:hypothetical protein
VVGSCEHGNELPGTIKCWEIVRIEVFMAATMKNVVFWGINTKFVTHRKYYVSVTECSLLKLCKI